MLDNMQLTKHKPVVFNLAVVEQYERCRNISKIMEKGLVSMEDNEISGKVREIDNWCIRVFLSR